jgi:hypothetical protein
LSGVWIPEAVNQKSNLDSDFGCSYPHHNLL